MDQNLSENVYSAAKDGKLYRLKMALQNLKTVDEVKAVVNRKVDGATPLVIASRNGHLDVVRYLVQNCEADVEMAGSVLFDGETIEGAPPLWCAAAAGHFATVNYLVQAGACVNSTTVSNSTPLRAACFDGHFNIVQFLIQRGADIEVSNRHGHTCLMIACFKGHQHIVRYLLYLNADVNKKSSKGNTALHDCAESGNLEILKLLIENGAKMDKDVYGMTPLLAASVALHTKIVDYIVHNVGICSRMEEIDAFELLGATYVDKGNNMLEAYRLWKKAMELRYDPDHTVIPKPNSKPVEAYDFAKEVQTIEELADLISDPDAMRIQALLIRERILGPAHPDTSYYIRCRGANYADSGCFNRCISLWNYALDMQQSMLEPLNPLTQSSLVSFTDLFSLMLEADSFNNSSGSRKVPTINFDDIIHVIKKCIREVENGAKLSPDAIPATDVDKDKNAFKEDLFQRVVIISLHLCCILAKLLPFLSTEQQHEAHAVVYSFTKVKIANTGQHQKNLLHFVCSSKTGVVFRHPACQFPCTSLVRMLCKAGVDVNGEDGQGNTPLHIAACSPLYKPEITRVLMEYGAHLDAVNKKGYTFKDLLPEMLPADMSCHILNEVKHITLACLAARAVRKFKIPFEKKTCPRALHQFILKH